MSYDVSGILVEKYPAVDVSGKFRKREFVISRIEKTSGFEYNDYIKFQLTQDRCNLIENLSLNENIKVSFNLRGRKWEKDSVVTYFTNLEAWKIEKLSANNQAGDNAYQAPPDTAPLPGEDDMLLPADETDDLPF